jgi:predicted transcriptional regulator
VKTVTFDVRAPTESMADFAGAWRAGKPVRLARISFASPELLWRVLTAKRWEVLKALCGAGPVSIREAARRVNRDVKAVHGDVTALLGAGVLDRAEGGGIVFPYEAIKVEFLFQAAWRTQTQRCRPPFWTGIPLGRRPCLLALPLGCSRTRPL